MVFALFTLLFGARATIIYHNLGLQAEELPLEHRLGPNFAFAQPLVPLGRGGTPLIGGLGKGTELAWLSCYRTHLQCRRPGFTSWVGKISTLSYRIPWTVESMGSQRVGHDFLSDFHVT